MGRRLGGEWIESGERSVSLFMQFNRTITFNARKPRSSVYFRNKRCINGIPELQRQIHCGYITLIRGINSGEASISISK